MAGRASDRLERFFTKLDAVGLGLVRRFELLGSRQLCDEGDQSVALIGRQVVPLTLRPWAPGVDRLRMTGVLQSQLHRAGGEHDILERGDLAAPAEAADLSI